MDVSIIIINYNTIHLLIDAIDSVLKKTDDVEYEIIVVDNNSKDNPKDILFERYGNKITYLGLSENIGFGRANNEAAKIAKGKHLFFLNPDTILLNNAVKILSDYLDNNPNVGCCGGNLVDITGNPTLSFNRNLIYSLFYEINELFFNLPAKLLYGENITYNYSNKPLEVITIIGADLMIKKEIFDRLCGFDPDFFIYHEESELEYRVKKAGYKIISVPYTHIIHLAGKSFSDNFEKQKRIYASRIIFLRKTHKRILIKIINILFILKIKQRLILFTLFRNKEKVIFWMMIYKLAAIYNKEE